MYERVLAAIDHPESTGAVLAAARELARLSAGEHEAGVIVMGAKGHGDLAALLLGSTTHKVIQLSDRPVLVVR